MKPAKPKPTQKPEELAWLIDLLRREGVTRYLEIGALYGDTFRQVAEALPTRARCVAVDLPGAPWGRGGSLPRLKRHVAALREAGRDAHLLIGDSGAPNVTRMVARLGPYEAVLIDGDHSLSGCWRDWKTYGAMGRIVAFHDIAWRRGPKWTGRQIEVPAVWRRLKAEHSTSEIIAQPGDCGIGVVFR